MLCMMFFQMKLYVINMNFACNFARAAMICLKQFTLFTIAEHKYRNFMFILCMMFFHTKLYVTDINFVYQFSRTEMLKIVLPFSVL